MELNKKVSIILVLKVLTEYSDENHYLTQQNIIDHIANDYNLELERKSVANSLQLLTELDYDIIKNPHGGYALLSRYIDKNEVTYLVDAIFSSKSIPGNYSVDIANKLASCLSKYDRKTYDYLYKSTELTRTSNKQVFLNIELINEAIKKNKWVGFKYVTYDDDGNKTYRYGDYTFHASPCYLVNNFGHYYLLAYRPKYDSVNAWRIDYMEDVSIMEERERKDPLTMKEFSKYKNISEYLNDHIYLFEGQVVEAKLLLKGSYVINYIYDWFGANAEVKKESNGLVAKIKCNETALFYWIMQYSEHITVLSPQSIIDRVKKAAEDIINKY